MASEPPASRIASVTLAVGDLDKTADDYVQRLGLARRSSSAERVTLGIGEWARLHLVRATAPRPAVPEPGLFHLAIRLPSRAALGRWALAAIASGVRFDGASDHGVSEAFYLADAEGNGVEVYADRSEERWPRDATGIAMTTRPMDVEAVLRAGNEAGGARRELPATADLGHVHLRVGDLAAAEAFYVGEIGLGITHRRPGALFLAQGRYHHDLAVNTWQTAGAGPRRPGSPGLVEFALVDGGPRREAVDPWGTRLMLGTAA